MSGPSIQWDAENTNHLLVENAIRNISKAEVEEVLLGTATVRWFSPKGGGRFFAQGWTAARRCLRVVYVGIEQMRPVSAWQRPAKECEQWQT
jgi:uncharacterized DUF497 family protein